MSVALSDYGQVVLIACRGVMKAKYQQLKAKGKSRCVILLAWKETFISCSRRIDSAEQYAGVAEFQGHLNAPSWRFYNVKFKT